MLEWLIPICAFWPVVAIYLGATSAEVEGGGGTRQVLGLLVSLIVFLAVWRLLVLVLGGIGPVLGALVLPTGLALLTLPVSVWVGYRLVGIAVRRHAQTSH